MSIVAVIAGVTPFKSIDEDQALVQQVQQGKAAAFELLYKKHYQRVYRIAKGVLLSPDDALDATQEIFTLAYKNIKKFDERSKFSTWLCKIALNRSIQEARRLQKYKKREAQLIEATDIPDAGPQMNDPHVINTLAQMKPQDRAVLVLHYWQQMTAEEIAQVMESTEGAVKVRLHRARDRFKNLYSERS